MKLYLRIISIQYLKGVTHLSKMQMYVKIFVPGCQEKRTPMAKKGNGNIAKWDDFPVEVEVADEVVISGQWRLQEILSGYPSTSINYTI